MRLEILVGLRGLARRPLGLALAVLCLAAGTCLSIVVLGLVESVLLGTLPYTDPDALFGVQDMRVVSDGDLLTTREYRSLASFLGPRSTIAAYRAGVAGRLELSTRIADTRYTGVATTGNIFDVLGVPPRLGRVLRERDDQGSAVISSRLWTRAFGADSSAVGTSLAVGDRTYLIVGVAKAGFWFPHPEADFWVPLDLARADDRPSLSSVVRLNRDLNPTTLQAELQRWSMSPDSTEGGRLTRVVATPLREAARPGDAAMFRLIEAIVLVLVALTCLSVANLFVARTIARSPAIGIFGALGASQFRQAIPSLVEVVVVGSLAALGGGALAVALIGPVTGGIALLGDTPPDPSRIVAWAALVLGIVVGSCAIMPLVLVRRSGRMAPTRVAGSGHSPPLGRTRAWLVAVQLIGSVVCVDAAFVLTLHAVGGTAWNPGFPTDRLALGFVPPGQGPRPAALLEWLAADPATESAGLAEALLIPEGRVTAGASEGRELVVRAQRVSPNLFATLGVPFVRGGIAPPGIGARLQGVVVDAPTAIALWQTLDVVGRSLKLGGRGSDGVWQTVIAVCPPFSLHPGGRNGAPGVFLVGEPAGERGATLVLRRRVDAAAELQVQGQQISLQPFDQRIRAARRPYEMLAGFVALLAAFAVLVASLGVYGLVAELVSSRLRECAIRAAMGAGRWDLARATVGWLLKALVVGSVVGLGLGALVARLVEGMVGAQVGGVAAYLGAGAIGVLASMAAMIGPIRKVSALDCAALLR